MAGKRQQMFGLDVMPLDYCESCRRTVDTTRNSLCLRCSTGILDIRRKMFPRSEGNVFMRSVAGRAFRNYFKEAST